MATVDNPAGRKLLNLPKVPTTYGGLKPYESSLYAKLADVTVPFRSKPNGALSYKRVKIQSVIAEKFKAAMEEIAKNPNIVTIWGGAYNFRPMNNDTENAKPNKNDRLASNHSLGLAFDMNVDWNPYRKDTSHSDDSYRMRSTKHPIVKAFVSRGFSWGGTWKKPDYMHFEYNNGDFSSDIYVDPDSIPMLSDGGGGGGDTGYSFNSGGSYASTDKMASNITNTPNTVYQLASTGERSDVVKLNDGRKDQFKALRESLKSESLGMGRKMLESPEMYNSSILKSTQAAKRERK